MAALNRSPSMLIVNLAFIRVHRLFAIDNPSPLPSVFLELSPRTNLSMSSSLDTLSGSLDIFLNSILTSPSPRITDA